MADAPKTIDFISKKTTRQQRKAARNLVMQQRLQQEIQRQHDVLVVPVLETYRNLADKLLHFLHW